MTSVKTDLGIVVGVEESPGANTVRWAAHEAALRKIPLTLVRVGLMPASGPSARVWTTAPTLNELREQHADEAQQILSKAIKIVEDSADSGDLPAINSKLLYSARVPTLVDLSKKAQMVVVGRDRGSRHSGDRGPLGLRSAGTQVPQVVMTSVVDQVSFDSCTPVYAGATSDASAHHSKRKRLA